MEKGQLVDYFGYGLAKFTFYCFEVIGIGLVAHSIRLGKGKVDLTYLAAGVFTYVGGRIVNNLLSSNKKDFLHNNSEERQKESQLAQKTQNSQ